MGSAMQRQPDGLPLGFVADFDRASSALENAVLALLAGGWDEGPRRLAHDMAAALRLAARGAGWWDSENALRAIESLLILSPQEVESIRPAVSQKLLELVKLLKKVPASRSA
jgi:hypothetical protein